MRVDLAADVFQGKTALLDLLSMLRCFAEERHDWVSTTETLVTAELYFRDHVPTMAATFVELGRKGTVSSVWSGSQYDPVRVCAADLGDHVADLIQSAVLVVENQDSDGCFVSALAHIFGATQLRSALSQHWLTIEHGGGSSLDQVAQNAISRFRCRIRVVALLDSDRLVPGEHTQAHIKAARLEEAGIAVHVLELREAENYVPNRILGRIHPRREAMRRLNYLKLLNAEQRGHFDMKQGFGPMTGPPIVPPSQRSLYSSISQQSLRGLRGGFGNELLRKMEEASVHMTEDDFASVGDQVVSELRSMLDKISGVI